MKLAVSNIGWQAEADVDVYNLMKKYGYTGLEIAPTRIFPDLPYNRLAEAQNWFSILKSEYGFVVPSMQSIWFGRQERLFANSQDRKILSDYTKQAIDFAQVIGCRNLVFGCPRNRNILEGEDEKAAVDFFKELGDYAVEHNTVIGMEANPPIYNTNYINNTVSALKLIHLVDSDGFLLNLDMGTIIENRELPEELIGKVHLINHVHISEPGLKTIERRELHVRLRDILKNEGYDGFISIEMGKTDNLSQIEQSMVYVKEIFG